MIKHILPPGPRLIATLGLSLATFLIVLDYSIANVSIPYIAGDLAISTDQGTYVITSFAVGNAIVLPICGLLTRRIGIVRLLIISLLLFCFFSWLCGISFSLPMLVISRFLQGAVAGPLIPVSQSLIVAIHPPEQKNNATALWSAVVIVAPLIGPILGGWISYDYHWSWIFYINIPFGLLCVLIIQTLLRDNETPIEKVKMDWIGLLLLAVAVSSLQIFLDKGEDWDWWNSYAIRSLAATSFVAFSFLIAWGLLQKDPVLELKLLKIRSFAIACTLMFIMYGLYFGTVVLIPLWLQTNMGYTPIWAGLTVAPMGILPFIFAKMAGKLCTRFNPLSILFFGILGFAGASFYTAFFTTAIDFPHLAFSRFITGAGILFFFTPLIIISQQGIPIEKLPASNGFFQFIRAMVGAIGTSVFTTLWSRRTEFHHIRLGETITPTSVQATQFFEALPSQVVDPEQKRVLLNMLVDQQASMLSLNDCFFLMGIIFSVLIFLLPFGHSKTRAKNPASFSANE